MLKSLIDRFKTVPTIVSIIYKLLDEEPGVARGKKFGNKKKFLKRDFFSLKHPRNPLSIQPFGQLSVTYIYIYECLVLLYRFILNMLFDF